MKRYKPIIAAAFLLVSCVTPSILVTREQNLGDSYFNNHNYAEAAIHYESMLNASSRLGVYRNLAMESDVHRKIANCNEMKGDYAKALEHVHSAMQLDSAENNLAGRIEDYRHEGKIYIYLGLYNKGIGSVEKAISLGEGMEQSLKNTDRLTVADNYLALSQLYSVTGGMNKAIEYARKSMQVFLQAGDRAGEMETLLVLGNVLADLGDLDAATGMAEKSARIAEELKRGCSRQYQLLAGIYSSLGKYEDALRAQEKALAEAVRVNIAGQIVWSTVGMGDIYSELGDIEKAKRYYRRASEIRDTTVKSSGSIDASLNLRLGEIASANNYFRTEGSLSGEAISSLRLSELYARDGKQDSALLMLGRAGKLFSLAGNPQGKANVQLMKGMIMVDRGENLLAEKLLDSSRQAPDFPETLWQAWFHTGRMYENSGQAEKAMESYKKSIAVIERIRGNLTIDEFKSIYFDSKREVYDRLINLMMKNNMPSDAWQLSEQARARAFYDIISGKKINFKGSAPGDLVTLEQEKRIEMQKLYKLLQKGYSGNQQGESNRGADLRQIKNSLVVLQTEYEDILQKLKLNNPSYAEMVIADPVNLEEIRPLLDQKTAMIEYWMNDTRLYIWVISGKGLTSRSVSTGSMEINSMIENCRRLVQSNSPEAGSRLSDLYRILIAPVENDIMGYSNLIIIPNQSLHLVPFQALRNRKGEFLVQLYNLEYEPSVSVWKVCSKKTIRQGNSFLGMALADTPVGNFDGLPGTEEELKKILPLFPDNLSAFGKESSETFARQNAGRFNFLHFATHGSINYRQPLYSFLLFPPSGNDDGRLSVYEVFEMDIDARLVTLSACETGLGNMTGGDEITGLSRAFLFAGSSAVIVSLWPVADFPTALLMGNFYRYLKTHTAEESLSLAQRDVIKQYPQPVYWAPFVLLGNGKITAK